MSLGAIFGNGSIPTEQLGVAQGYMNGLNALQGNLGNQQSYANNLNAQQSAGAQRALGGLTNYLSSNPWTNTTNAGYLSNAENGAAENAAHAQGNLSMNLAARGISPNSSIGVGGLASIANQQNATDAQARYNLANTQQQDTGNRLSALYNVQNGAANQSFGQGMDLSNARAGLDQNLFGDADTVAQQKYSSDLNQFNYNQQQNQAKWNAYGNIATSLIGGL